MPEGRITPQKLRDHFRRLWIIYLAGIVALSFLNHLIFTITRPGFSDDETLKIMLLNTEDTLPEQEILAAVSHLGFRAIETEMLFISPEDPMAAMLLSTKLATAYCDLCLADEAGMQMLAARDACMEGGIIPLENGLYLAAAKNTTTPQNALDALMLAAEKITE